LYLEEYQKAMGLFARVRNLCVDIGNPLLEAEGLRSLGEVAFAQRNHAGAETFLRK